MNISRFVVLASATFLLSACAFTGALGGNVISGSGKPTTRTFDFSDFTSISLSNSFQAEITRADSFGVEITADDNLFDHIQVTKQGTTLQITLDETHQYSFGPNTLKAKLTLPTLTGVTLSGASHATLSGFESTQDLNVNVSGASRLDGDIESGAARIDANGGSQVSLQGSGQNATLRASGASQLQLGHFALDSANVNLSGASTATVNVKSRLDYDLSGASHLTYSGNPTIGSSRTSGASSASQQ